MEEHEELKKAKKSVENRAGEGGIIIYPEYVRVQGGLTNARLCGFAHARNDRGCRQVEAVNATAVLRRDALRNFHG